VWRRLIGKGYRTFLLWSRREGLPTSTLVLILLLDDGRLRP
jgi:hypothetical protein